LNAYLWRTDQFHWWIGQRRHLLQVSEFINQPQPRINVDQRLYPGKSAEHDMARDQPAQPVKILFRHEVVENVNFHWENPRVRTSPFLSPCFLAGDYL